MDNLLNFLEVCIWVYLWCTWHQPGYFLIILIILSLLTKFSSSPKKFNIQTEVSNSNCVQVYNLIAYWDSQFIFIHHLLFYCWCSSEKNYFCNFIQMRRTKTLINLRDQWAMRIKCKISKKSNWIWIQMKKSHWFSEGILV